MKENHLRFFARNKLRFFVGLSFIGIIMSIFNFLTFAKVWSGTFEYYSISPTIVYVTIPLVLVIGCWYAGFWYEINKVWAYETSHMNTNVNPEFIKLIETVDRLEIKIDKLEKRAEIPVIPLVTE